MRGSPGLSCEKLGEDSDGKMGYVKKHSRRLWESLKVSGAIDLGCWDWSESQRGEVPPLLWSPLTNSMPAARCLS